jgi:GT2 family glycosyltransferase
MNSDRLRLAVIIPTYQRDAVLVSTIEYLLGLETIADEIHIMDQSESHDPKTTDSLENFTRNGHIHWHRLQEPSIPKAMNCAMLKTNCDVVLFLDDDIALDAEIVEQHKQEYKDIEIGAVAGRVIQPWSSDTAEENSYLAGVEGNPDGFNFNSGKRMDVLRFMGGNVSFRRSQFVEARGFDENFVKVAYRFEAEFAARFVATGNRIVYNPEARIRHLKVSTGGTRTYGEHYKTFKPGHAVGRYYYLLVVDTAPDRWKTFFLSPFLSCKTRFHFSHPLWIPITFFAELTGLVWALVLKVKGQKLIGNPSQSTL